MNEEITIILTTPEAVQFREFQKNYKVFKDYQKFHNTFAVVAQSGVFDINYGSATLHFAKNELQKVTIQADTWKKVA